jgi:hypothetical protein
MELISRHIEYHTREELAFYFLDAPGSAPGNLTLG